MKITTEKTIQIKSDENFEIVRANVKIAEDGSGVEINIVSKSLTEQTVDEEYLNKYFPIVEVSKLSLDDEFLKEYQPRDKNIIWLKSEIEKIIRKGLPDFRCPTVDPSVKGEEYIFFAKGSPRAVGKTPVWWQDKAEEFMPERKSRLGTLEQYIAFIAVLIKYLVEEEHYNIVSVWNAVFYNSEIFLKTTESETKTTGADKIGKWYDLLNSCKIVRIEDKYSVMDNFTMVGDFYYRADIVRSLFRQRCVYAPSIDESEYATGWIVLDV